MNNKISACIIVRNEEKEIERCLNSIVNVVDEIIVVHDGECEDRTLEISRKYNAKVFIRGKRENFNSHRIFCLKQARFPWILRIDADEYLSDELAESIRKLVLDQNANAYDFSMPLWDDKKRLTKKWPYIRVLFRKDKISFLGILHYAPDVKSNVKKCDLAVWHRPGYNNYSREIFRTKWLNKAKVHAKIYLQDFSKIEKFNYKGNDWPIKIKLRVRFPIILMPAEFVITFIKNLSSGGYKEGIIGYKVALMYGIYRVMVNYNIFINKNFKK
ncbi:MAG: glycosyltransferase family 2 protein [Candidatus Falkowbacteria bacterium]|nr:glycosyltransferase family 2 protein [Candidatus Parcubacteria bacterium]